MRTPRFAFAIFILVAAALASLSAQSPGPIELTYIANEGFLIVGGGKKVLVDALLREGIPESYLRPAPETLKKMEASQPPFDAVDLVLATHFHRDHFDATSVAAHLRANPRAKFISVHEATELVHKAFPAGARESARIVSTTPEFGRKISLTFADVPVQVIRLRHGRFQNTGFLITLAGKKILHLGDSDGDVSNFDTFDLEKEKIDVALVPYWYFLSGEGKRVVREQIDARNVFAIHVGIEENVGRDLSQIRREFPGVIIATEPGRRWTF